jgi:O-antigen/teichoic acid export membrane protein
MPASRNLSPQLWRNALWLLSGNGIRFVVSGLYFVLLARLLGPANFGLFSAVLACANLASPFAYWGQPDLLVQQMSRRPHHLRQLWGQALILASLGGLVFTLLLTWPLSLWLPGLDPLTAGLLLLSELGFYGIQYVQKGMLIGQERIAQVAQLDTGMAVARLILVLIILGWGESSLEVWSWAYAGTALGVALWIHWQLQRQMGPLQLSWGDLRDEHTGLWIQCCMGWDFAVGLVAIKTFTDLDKLLLPSLASAAAGGIYSAAYRLINIAQTPMLSLLTSSFAEVCRQGQQGIRSAWTYSVRLLPWVVGYGGMASLLLASLAGGLPWVLGADYRETAQALRWLSAVIGLEGLHVLLSNVLTGAECQRLRGQLQVMAVLLNAGLNLWWIPLWQWRGAAAATLVAEILLVLSLGAVILHKVAVEDVQHHAEE